MIKDGSIKLTFNNIEKYSYINAKTRARISKFLNEDTLKGIYQAASVSEAIEYLLNTNYHQAVEVFRKSGDLGLVEMKLHELERNFAHQIYASLSGGAQKVAKSLLIKYELENVKSLLRLWFDRHIRHRDITGKTAYLFRKKLIHFVDIEGVLAESNLTGVAMVLKNTPYGSLIEKNQSVIESRASLFFVEMALDNYYLAQLLESLEVLAGNDKKVTEKCVRLLIDLENISKFIYAKKLKIDPKECGVGLFNGKYYKKNELIKLNNEEDWFVQIKTRLRITLDRETEDDTEDLTDLLHNQLVTRLAQKIKTTVIGNPFTSALIVLYFLLLFHEISNIVGLLNAKNYGLNEEEIKKLLC